MGKNKFKKLLLIPGALLNQNNNIIENFTKTLFSLIEWLIILTTLRFVQIKTGSFYIGLIFQTGCIFWVFFVIKKILNLTRQLIKLNHYYLEDKPKKQPKFQIIPIIIAFIFGGIIGIISIIMILEIIQKLLITINH